MSKRELQQYYNQMEREISTWAYQDQLKFEFSKKYVDNLHTFKGDNSNLIQIGPLNKRLLEFLIFTILIEFERSFWES